MSLKRNSRQSVAAVIASYAAFLAMPPGTDERRRPLIEEVVRDCDERYRRLLYAVIREMGLCHEDAEDVIQGILLRWTRQLEAGRKLPAPEALKVWFRRVAHNSRLALRTRAICALSLAALNRSRSSCQAFA